MHWKFDDVNQAFLAMTDAIDSGKVKTTRQSSRVGDVIRVDEPILITYENPLRRVLFNKGRDCNPFFHLYEAMWMLAGWKDVKSMSYYSRKFAEFVDDGDGQANAAYGDRWRHAPNAYFHLNSDLHHEPEVDQLAIIINHLRRVPTSRRAVLQMWRVEDDLLRIGPGKSQSKDVCCNTAVYFSLRLTDGEYKTIPSLMLAWDHAPCNYHLDMTVTNRSNDLTLGTCGSDFVTFSFLQEYVANCLGVRMGEYHQFSNNLHAYTSRWEPGDYELAGNELEYKTNNEWRHVALVRSQHRFDQEVKEFVDWNSDGSHIDEIADWEEPFLKFVAQPMMVAFHYHKRREYWNAFNRGLVRVRAGDWQLAGHRWLQRRQKAHELEAGEETRK